MAEDTQEKTYVDQVEKERQTAIEKMERRGDYFLEIIENSGISNEEVNDVVEKGLKDHIFEGVDDARVEEIIQNTNILFSLQNPHRLDAFKGIKEIVYKNPGEHRTKADQELFDIACRVNFYLYCLGQLDRYSDDEITGIAATFLFHQDALFAKGETTDSPGLMDGLPGSKSGNAAIATFIDYHGQNLDYEQ